MSIGSPKCRATRCHEVLKGQLYDFVEGGVFDREVKEILDTTNLVGKRLFGDLDFDMKKKDLHTLQTYNQYVEA